MSAGPDPALPLPPLPPAGAARRHLARARQAARAAARAAPGPDPVGPGGSGAAGVVGGADRVPPVPPPRAEEPAARLLWRLEATAEALAFAGLAPWELDEAAEAAGFAEGPCARMDRLGLDAALARRRRFGPAGAEPGVIARMVAEGRLGRKASVGWARYPGGGGRVTDPLIEDLVREEARFARRPALTVAPAQGAAALVLALVDEAAALAAAPGGEGAALDLAAVLACGFPQAFGGPDWLRRHWGPAAAAAYGALARALPGVLPPPRGLDGADASGDRTG